METQNFVEEALNTSVTEHTLKACLECAVQEFPANKQLHISIGSLINRFYRSRDNMAFVTQTLKNTPEQERSDIVSSPGFSEWKPNRGTFSKKTLPLTPVTQKETVAGKGIADVMARLGEKIAGKVFDQAGIEDDTDQGDDENIHEENVNEDQLSNSGNATTDQDNASTDLNTESGTGSDNTAVTDTAADDTAVSSDANVVENQSSDPERSPLLDLSVDEFDKMYGGLKGLKAFAKETLGIEPPRTANVEGMVKLIKTKLANVQS